MFNKFKNLFQQWELVEENKPMVERTTNIFGLYDDKPVIVDVYRKKKFSGIYKYKSIERFKQVDYTI